MIQKNLFLAPAGTYSGMMDVYKHLMKTEGLGALYKGFTPVMIRAFPANAVSLLFKYHNPVIAILKMGPMVN